MLSTPWRPSLLDTWSRPSVNSKPAMVMSLGQVILAWIIGTLQLLVVVEKLLFDRFLVFSS